MRKRILYIWKGPFPFEIRIQKICDSLAKAGYDITVLCRWNGEALQREKIGDLKIVRAGFNKSNKQYIYIPLNPNWRHTIAEIVSKIKPDLIINREFYLLTETISVAKKTSIPVIVDMAENYPAALRDFRHSQTPLKQLLFKTLRLPDRYERYCIPQADGVIVVCEEQISRLVNLGVNQNVIEVVHNTPTSDSSLLFRPYNNNGIIRFIHHGYLSGDKSILTFILGFLSLADKRNDIEFVIAGAGECDELYKSAVSRSRHKDKIKFIGAYDINKLNSILATADVGVLPFQITEFNNYTIQNKLFDYFANSLPVLVSKCTPLMRVINETGAGFIGDCSTPENCEKAISAVLENINPSISEKAFLAYKNKYNWNFDESILIKFIKSFL